MLLSVMKNHVLVLLSEALCVCDLIPILGHLVTSTSTLSLQTSLLPPRTLPKPCIPLPLCTSSLSPHRTFLKKVINICPVFISYPVHDDEFMLPLSM